MIQLLLILCATLSPQPASAVSYSADRHLSFVQLTGDAYTCPSALYARQDALQVVFSTPGCARDTLFRSAFDQRGAP